MRRGALLVVLALLAGACRSAEAVPTTTTTTLPVTTTTLSPAEQAGLHWWNDRVFYEVFVRSFKDSDGDGVGDFAGLTASLDYLNDGDPSTTTDLGITGIWLMPVNPSPSYHGYDVTDYRDINPDFGTMDDFETFLAAAHERGIAVLMDLVLNHTSIDHPWFQASAAADPEYADWYLWSETDPATTGPWGQQVWHELNGRYYFGLFWEGMPDLNLENPDVTAELRDVARFWLDVGVDGFRLDAARHLIEEGTVMADTPETVAWLEGFNSYVDGIAPRSLVLGEVWSPTPEVAAYIPKALDLAFEFDLSAAGGSALQSGFAAPLLQSLDEVLASYPDDQYAVFLTNHDQDRLMSVVGGDVRIAKLAATWLLTAPGVPFIYYGEEVGLQGVKPDERIRTPMPWTPDAPGVGFTEGTPWETVDAGYPEFNVALEDADPSSLLHHYRALVQFRDTSPALRYGDLAEVDPGSGRLFAYLRSEGDDHVLVVGNVSDQPVADYALDLASGPLSGVQGAVSVVGPAAGPPVVNPRGGLDGYRPVEEIPAYGGMVIHLTTEVSPTSSTTTTTLLPPTTTTGVPATAADAAVVEQFWTLQGEGDRAWEDFFSPTAEYAIEGGAIGLYEPLPPGAVAIGDWDGDGTSTIADIITQQVAWGAATQATADVTCEPAGSEILCTAAGQSDIFFERAGVAGFGFTQRFTVADGRIVRFADAVVEPDGAFQDAIAAWTEQTTAYEQWVHDTYPDEYERLFTGPCCSGNPNTFITEPDTIDRHTALLDEWAAS